MGPGSLFKALHDAALESTGEEKTFRLATIYGGYAVFLICMAAIGISLGGLLPEWVAASAGVDRTRAGLSIPFAVVAMVAGAYRSTNLFGRGAWGALALGVALSQFPAIGLLLGRL